MNKEEADAKFQELLKDHIKLKLNCPLPENKQKNEKSGYALLTCMVNILIAKELKKNLTVIMTHIRFLILRKIVI
ncbi:MAG: hypothetical protein IPL26_07025 [Leptospiraceae bacterium]|nr:hypothetical protein [Leptospiraceae bacterium]